MRAGWQMEGICRDGVGCRLDDAEWRRRVGFYDGSVLQDASANVSARDSGMGLKNNSRFGGSIGFRWDGYRGREMLDFAMVVGYCFGEKEEEGREYSRESREYGME